MEINNKVLVVDEYCPGKYYQSRSLGKLLGEDFKLAEYLNNHNKSFGGVNWSPVFGTITSKTSDSKFGYIYEVKWSDGDVCITTKLPRILLKLRSKMTGEVFTPTPFVQEILDKLPSKVFIDSKKTFCDPACGDGRFLVEVLKRKLDAGHNLHEASSTIYGVDLMSDNIELCKKRLRAVLMNYMELSGKGRKLNGGVNDNINNNVVCADALSWDFINWLPNKIERQKSSDEGVIGDEDDW